MHSQNQSRMLLAEAENGSMRDVNFPFSVSSPSNASNSVSRKRHSEDGDDASVPSKRGPAPLESIPPPVPASSRSNLQEKNKMLASLLAKEPSTPPQVQLHPSIITATPQDRLVRVLSTSTRVTTPGEIRPLFHRIHLIIRFFKVFSFFGTVFEFSPGSLRK